MAASPPSADPITKASNTSSAPLPAPVPHIVEPASTPSTPAPPKPASAFITTHVLDQTTGLPAARVLCTLTLTSTKTQPSYTASTSPTTGRITSWTPSTPTTAPLDQVLPLLSMIKEQKGEEWKAVWSLTFETEEYWKKQGKETFYPQVEVRFSVDPDDVRGHWHVPVLLGPYGYTTYRGS